MIYVLIAFVGLVIATAVGLGIAVVVNEIINYFQGK